MRKYSARIINPGHTALIVNVDIVNVEDACGKTYGVNTEGDPSRPVTLSCVIRQGDGYEKLRDVVTHGDETCGRRKHIRGVNCAVAIHLMIYS